MARRGNLQVWIEKSITVHGKKYDYSKSVYARAKSPILIGCPLHGDFFQTPQDHASGSECSICAYSKRGGRKINTTEWFISEATKIHGNKYEYNSSVYLGDKIPVKVICNLHGEFLIRPCSHLRGFSGCGGCEKCGYKKEKPATFYVLESGNIVKVGITNRLLPKRLWQINRSSKLDFAVISSITCEDGNKIFELEKRVLKKLRATHDNPINRFDGHTECFVDVNLTELEILITEIYKELT
jgi:hypothetical protein